MNITFLGLDSGVYSDLNFAFAFVLNLSNCSIITKGKDKQAIDGVKVCGLIPVYYESFKISIYPIRFY